MKEHLSSHTLEGMGRRQLAPQQLLEASDHLTACADCRDRLSGMTASWDTVARLRDDLDAVASEEQEHLSEIQVLTFIGSRPHDSDDVEREMIESHLAVCTRCAEVTRDVRKFAVSSPARDFAPSKYAWVLAAAAMMVIGIGSGWLFSQKYRSEVSRLEARLIEAERAAEALRGKLAVATPAETTRPESTGPTEVAARFKDAGGEITIARDGKVTGLPNLDAETESLVAAALRDRTIKTPRVLVELAGRKGQLLGPSDAPTFSVLQPVGEIVESRRPTFRWRKLEGAESYVVRIYDSRLTVVASSDPLQVTTWNPSKPLVRGETFGWTVTANKEGKEITSPAPPSPEARFRVVSNAEVEALNQARRNHKDSHLILGLLYARTGLITEAERELAALAQANPDSEVVKQFLLSLRQTRR